MFLKLSSLSLLLLLFLFLISFAVGYSPVGNAKSHPLKLRKRISYSDGGVLAQNGGARKMRMPTRKMVEKPRMRFKGGNKLSPKHNGQITAHRQ